MRPPLVCCCACDGPADRAFPPFLCSQGKLDPCVGRKKQIERVIQILGRRTKNNPCLIGKREGGGRRGVRLEQPLPHR